MNLKNIFLSLSIAFFTLNAFGQVRGESAPNFTVYDDEGNASTLEDYKGKVVYISFWASWCAPCKKTFIETDDIRRQLKKEGVVLLNISLDKDLSKWQEAIYVFDLYGDNKIAKGRDIYDQFRIGRVPQFHIIDKKGNLAYLSNGRENALQDFRKLLAE